MGFVVGWITELAANLETLYVICQEKGDALGLPANVFVYSFGKEKGYGKIRQGLSLISLSLTLANKADGFFVHQHPIYAILVSLAAKFFHCRLVFWYAHGHVDFKLKLATMLADRIVSSSPEGFRYQTRKARFIGQAIDTNKFKMKKSKIKMTNHNAKFKIISIGRISPVKNYEKLIKAAEILVKKKKIGNMVVQIYGGIGLARHQNYLDSLIKLTENAGLTGIIEFRGPVPHESVPELLAGADLFVNLSATGSMDKAVLEAMAAGCLVLTSNEAYGKILPSYAFIPVPQAEAIAAKIWEQAAAESGATREHRLELRRIVTEQHSIAGFIRKLLEEFH